MVRKIRFTPLLVVLAALLAAGSLYAAFGRKAALPTAVGNVARVAAVQSTAVAVPAPKPADAVAPVVKTPQTRTAKLTARSQRPGFRVWKSSGPPRLAPRGERADADEDEDEETDRDKPRPDHPGEAMRFRMLSLQDDNGYIPPDGLVRAQQHMRMMRAQQAQGIAPVAGISRGGWTWKGPGNIGGRTRALAIDPSNPNIIFAGTVGGGIWKTTNAGASWTPVNDFMANLAVTSIVYRPGSPATMLAGTGEGFFNGDAIRGNGIFRSLDGGTTWTQLPSTNTTNYSFVNRLAFSADGTIALAATATGVFRSVDGGATWGATPVLTIAGNSTATDVKFLPGSNTGVVASGYTGRAFVSVNGGASFVPATGLTGVNPFFGASFTRVELQVAPTAPAVVYAAIDTDPSQLWKSVDGGASYTLVSSPNHLNSQGWYDNVIWVDPTNANTVIVGGIDLFRSTNGGVNFTKISSWQFAPDSAHADQHAILADPGYNGTTNKRVYFGNDGGVYKAEDVLAVTSAPLGGFTPLNNNFGATQFYGAAGHAGTGRITGGTQDNGDLFLATGGGTSSWVDQFGGDGGFSAYDPADANLFYGEYVGLTLHRNTTGGADFSEDGLSGYSLFTGNCKPVPFRIIDTCFGNANFIAPFILDPNDPNTMLAGGISLWRTNDVKTPILSTAGADGPTWTEIKTPTTGFNPINAIAVAPGAPAIIYVGHNNGDIFRTTNGTAATPTWTKVDTASVGNRAIERIAIDPNNANIVYAALGGFTTNNLMKSIDGGTSWNPATGAGATGLPAAPIRGIAIHATNAGWIYVGTEVGVFASTDGGATWGLPHDGPANVSVDELSWMGTTLVAATHGRGIFTTSVGPATFVSNIAMDSPANGSTVNRPFTVSGWALNRGATSGTGVDAVHVHAFPSGGGASTFLGAATYGQSRPDVGAAFGVQFTNSGWTLSNVGASLTPGTYTVTAFAHNSLNGTFDATASATITIPVPTSQPFISVDAPAPGATVTSAFEVGGWAFDAGAPSGTGVNAVQFFVVPEGSPAPGVFVGTGTYGLARADVGAAFGSRFTNSGFHFTITGLGPGNYTLGVYARSTVTNDFTITRSIPFSVNANALMSIDLPGPESTVSAPTFDVAGWAIDRAIEGVGPAGTGVDALHVYAYPDPGSGIPPIFLGVATQGIARSDVAAIYGARYTNSGYTLSVSRAASGLAPGVYNIVVHAHSSATGAFNNFAAVRIVIQ